MNPMPTRQQEAWSGEVWMPGWGCTRFSHGWKRGPGEAYRAPALANTAYVAGASASAADRAGASTVASRLCFECRSTPFRARVLRRRATRSPVCATLLARSRPIGGRQFPVPETIEHRTTSPEVTDSDATRAADDKQAPPSIPRLPSCPVPLRGSYDGSTSRRRVHAIEPNAGARSPERAPSHARGGLVRTQPRPLRRFGECGHAAEPAVDR